MKPGKYWIVLGMANVVLLAVCGTLFMGKDRNAPRIVLSGSGMAYAAGAGEEMLFRGVSAYDEEDGDLTGEVIIEKIVEDHDKETATVTYGVADRAGNVGKATCTVTMIPRKEPVTPEEGVAEETASGEEMTSVEETASEEETTSEEETEETGAEETREEEVETPETEEEGSEETPESGEEEAETEAREREEQRRKPVERNESSEPEPGRPSILLKAGEIKTRAGSTPVWVSVLEGLHDDKDDYGTLFQSLKINGEYNRDVAGTYAVTLTVTDSDGQESDACPISIIVEE